MTTRVAPETSSALALRGRELDTRPAAPVGGNPRRLRVALPPDAQAQATERLALLRPVLDWRAAPERPDLQANGTPIRTLTDYVSYVAAQHDLSARTIWRLLDRWDHPEKYGAANSFVALADRARSNRGRSRIFERYPEAAAFLQVKYVQEGLNMAHCCDALCREWRRFSPKKRPPSYAAVAAFLNSLPRPVITLAHEGERSYLSKCAPCVRRKRPAPMEWWVLDGRTHDVHVMNTLFPALSDEKRIRLSMILVVDWGSTMVLGWCFSPTESHYAINSGMRMAVAEYGFPRNLLWDNGKAFQKAGRMLLSDELRGLLLGNSVEITRALPYNAKAKPIESWFRPWAERFDREFGTAYGGRSPEHRSENCDRALARHEKYLKGTAPDSPLPSDRKFIEQAVWRIDEHNREKKNYLGGRTPQEIFGATYPPEKRPTLDPLTLACLFWEREKRIVGRGGCVTVEKIIYEPLDEYVCALGNLQGRAVVVRYDGFNLGRAIALDDAGHFLGELRIQPLALQSAHGRDPLSREAIQKIRRRTTALKREAEAYLDWLAVASAHLGVRTELEYRAERHLGTGTDGTLLAAVPAAASAGCASRPQPRLASAFVSDDVERDREAWTQES